MQCPAPASVVKVHANSGRLLAVGLLCIRALVLKCQKDLREVCSDPAAFLTKALTGAVAAVEREGNSMRQQHPTATQLETLLSLHKGNSLVV